MDKLQKFVEKDICILTSRCNKSIRFALKTAKNYFSKNGVVPKLLIQDQGGWMTYSQFAKKEKLELITLETKKGKLLLSELKKHHDSILLIHSMPGYCYKEDMKKIAKICKQNNIFLINDCCGSIGTEDAKYGDILVCSFGKYKPLSIGKGGFIAYNDEISEYAKPEPHSIDEQKLAKELINLPKKLAALKKIKTDIEKEIKKNDLGEIMNKDQGINILIKPKTREKLIKYCDDKKLYFTECPRYIRSNIKGICIEIKRKGDIRGM